MSEEVTMTEIGGTADSPRGEQVAEQFRLLVQHSPDMVSIYDLRGCFAFASAAHERILGFTPEELLGRDPRDLVHPDDVERIIEEFAAQLTGRHPSAPVEMRFRAKDGSYRCVEAVVADLTGVPPVGGILVTARDVSDRKRAELIMQEQAQALERIARGALARETLDTLCLMVERWIERACAVVLVQHDQGMRVAAAPSVPQSVRDALDKVQAHHEMRRRLAHGPVAGSVITVSPRPVADKVLLAAGLRGWWAAPIYASGGERADGEGMLGTITAFLPEAREPTPMERQLLASVGSLAAIALERDEAQARLAHQASHDALTGLPNREHLIQRLQTVVEEHAEGISAVYFLDLDRFKVFNDSAGHDIGDRILIDVAVRLRSALREGDAVARFGGDEFVVVCGGLADADEVMAVAHRLLQVISQPFDMDGLELVVTASIGVAVVDGNRPEALLRDADTAMYHAKDRGRSRVEVFDAALRAQMVDRLEIERDLRRALETDELVLHYQPVVSLRAGRLCGFESLVRWNHPTRGLLLPDQFLDVAEDAGLIARIGARAQRMAFRQWAEWHRDHPEWGEFVVGVNLAAAELRDASLPAHVKARIEETGADPRFLVFEASERVLATDTEAAAAVLGELRDLGVLTALDDFGTGSSPLLHLRRFPISIVKLDLALVAGVGVHHDDNVLVRGVIKLAHRLGLFVVAEGVETAAQVEQLRAHGCLLAQGHLFAGALPPDAAAEWVTAGRPGFVPAEGVTR